MVEKYGVNFVNLLSMIYIFVLCLPTENSVTSVRK